MNVFVNDVPVSLGEGSTLSDALTAKGIQPGGIATAVNGVVVPASNRSAHILSEGDKIVIIKAFYGG